MKIAVGTGSISKKGFKINDIRDLPNVDYVCPAWELDKHIKPNSVQEIVSNHFFEHLTFEQGEIVLEVWYKLLCNGGKVSMQLPNMDAFIKYWNDSKETNDLELFNWVTKGIWGWQRDGLTETWDVHKSGYNAQSLERLVTGKGFVKFKNLKTKYENLKIEFFKAEQ